MEGSGQILVPGMRGLQRCDFPMRACDIPQTLPSYNKAYFTRFLIVALKPGWQQNEVKKAVNKAESLFDRKPKVTLKPCLLVHRRLPGSKGGD
jgi:hypothetical protein